MRKLLSEIIQENGHTLTGIPEKWSTDPFLENGRLYYSIAPPLWEAVVNNVGKKRFSTRDIEREPEIANAIGNPLRVVGVWKDNPVVCHYLLPFQDMSVGKQAEQVLGKTLSQLAEIEGTAEQRLRTLELPIRAYLGWLLTNVTFLDEHDELIQKYPRELTLHGFPQPVHSSDPARQQIKHPQGWLSEFHHFFTRWRLQTLAAPYLPVPLAPQIPDYRSSREGVVSVFLPDISPVLGRGVIAESLEDALHFQAPDHLREWFEIIRKENSAKNIFASYERRFPLQHYWRVLQHRYPEALSRKNGALIGAFATYFDMSTDTIKSDIRFFKKRLGADWMHRFALLD